MSPAIKRLRAAGRAVARWIRMLLNPGYVAHLEGIIKHVDIHGAYKRGGYREMTTPEKRTFDRLSR